LRESNDTTFQQIAKAVDNLPSFSTLANYCQRDDGFLARSSLSLAMLVSYGGLIGGTKGAM
jgi:hypothetical protein